MNPVAHMQCHAEIGNTSYRIFNPIDYVTDENISHNNSTHNNTGDIYIDGIIDNFDNFKNLRFPSSHYKVCF
jgi:hypothetical protein